MEQAVETGTALVALGSNLSFEGYSPAGIVQEGLRALRQLSCGHFRASALYRTPAFPAGSGPDFVNAAAAFSTALDARTLLSALHRIEAAAGRVRAERWAARVLDLDLLGLGAQVLPDRQSYCHWAGLDLQAQRMRAPDGLILPHPRLHERAFVLVPLADVAPDWVHPVLGDSVVALCATLPAAALADVVALPGSGAATTT